MGWIGSKLICFFMELLCFVIQTANLFLANIVIYEASTGVSFDFGALLNNYIFWMLVNQVVDYSEKGDFVSANKVLKLLKKIQKERR